MKQKETRSKEATVQKPVNCISCGNLITANYCSTCGEKRLKAHDFELKHFIEETFEGFTHFDNKFFKSVWLLISKPGLLSVDFCKGKRVHYMRPFALFFVCNILFFLLGSQNNIFSLPLYSFDNFQPFTNFGTKQAIKEVAATKAEYAALTLSFNQKMGTDAKTFLAVFIPLLALGGMVLQYKKYVTEHLVFATHFFAFVVLYYGFLTVCVINPYYYLFSKGSYDTTFDLITTLGSLLIFGIYYFKATKRFYQTRNASAILTTGFTLILFIIGFYAYRIALFYKIIKTISI